MTTIAELFASYQREVIPAEASPLQLQECRRAFYGGAFMLLTMLLLIIGDPDAAEEAGVAQLEELLRECRAFADAEAAAGPVAVVPIPPGRVQ